MRIFITLLLAVLVWAALPVAMVPAVADASEIGRVRVMQRRPFLRRNRFEVAPATGLTVNDPMITHYFAGADVNYHINEYLSAGLSIYNAFSSESKLYDQVQGDYLLVPLTTKVDYLATAQASLALVYGKVSLFNMWPVFYDTSFTVGAGAVGLRGDAGITGNYGLGGRVFLTRWLTFNMGLRHYMFMDNGLTHGVAVLSGLSVFFPFGFEYGTN